MYIISRYVFDVLVSYHDFYSGSRASFLLCMSRDLSFLFLWILFLCHSICLYPGLFSEICFLNPLHVANIDSDRHPFGLHATD